MLSGYARPLNIVEGKMENVRDLNLDSSKRTMRALSYGISTPDDLMEKLRLDAAKLEGVPAPYDIFNFIVTAAVLAEWVEQYYSESERSAQFRIATRKQKWVIPEISEEWISDSSCIPNIHSGVDRNIINCLSICIYTANASKHFHWRDNGAINSIGESPPIEDAYQYFFTSTDPDIYVEFHGENYGIKQIRGILLQFFSGLIAHLKSG
jgi:hypothetical protein